MKAALSATPSRSRDRPSSRSRAAASASATERSAGHGSTPGGVLPSSTAASGRGTNPSSEHRLEGPVVVVGVVGLMALPGDDAAGAAVPRAGRADRVLVVVAALADGAAAARGCRRRSPSLRVREGPAGVDEAGGSSRASAGSAPTGTTGMPCAQSGTRVALGASATAVAVDRPDPGELPASPPLVAHPASTSSSPASSVPRTAAARRGTERSTMRRCCHRAARAARR